MLNPSGMIRGRPRSTSIGTCCITVVSILHLEPYYEDGWNRQLPPEPPPVVVNGTEQFEVEKILEESAGYCRVKWRHWDEETWEPMADLREDVPDLLRKFQEQRRDARH